MAAAEAADAADALVEAWSTNPAGTARRSASMEPPAIPLTCPTRTCAARGSVRDNCTLWAECIGGAQEENRYLRLIEQAGLSVEHAAENERYRFTQESTINAAAKFQVHSVRILARRPS